MQFVDWKAAFDAELQNAEQARKVGNEGKARVCARRAAGFVIRQYLLQGGISSEGLDAYQLIVTLKQKTGLSRSAHEILEHLSQRVEPGGIFPLQVDLIVEARRLPRLLGMANDEDE